jgi:Ca2+-binding EF-hand superfamily protein
MGNRMSQLDRERYSDVVDGQLSVQEIEHLHARFHKFAPQKLGGIMSETAFAKYIHAFRAFPHADSSNRFPHLYRAFAANNDPRTREHITFTGYLRYHAVMSCRYRPALHDQLCETLFAAFDAAGVGVVSTAQIRKAMALNLQLTGAELPDAVSGNIEYIAQQGALELVMQSLAFAEGGDDDESSDDSSLAAALRPTMSMSAEERTAAKKRTDDARTMTLVTFKALTMQHPKILEDLRSVL